MLLFKKMDTSSEMPVIGMVADRKLDGELVFQAVGEKYLTGGHGRCRGGAADHSQSCGAVLSRAASLQRIDGVLLTGSHSNVEPYRYGGPPASPARCMIRSATP